MLKLFLLLSAGGVLSVPLLDIIPGDSKRCGYESCTQAEAGLLNVHIVPHTHDDVGWLKTVDQYYYGSRNNIQKAGVQYILDSVVKELWEDPKRRFVYVETAFFWKWWTRQTDAMKEKVRTLVSQGRLQFAGGAWSMNDEAASHYHSTIDQFTFGLNKLNDTFGECGRPHVGWQIDPFGHSREFASLLAAMGYDGLFLGRIDYQDKRVRLARKEMEMVWRGDDDLGNTSDIFTSVLYNTYSPPPGFCFDVLCDDEPIIDDPNSPMFNVDLKVFSFLDRVRLMSQAYRSDNILVTMGDDFQYQDAGMWFKNLDKLIQFEVNKLLDYVNEMGKRYRSKNVLVTMGGDFTYQDAAMWYTNLDKLIEYTNLKAAKDGLNVKLFYSTPDCYLKAVKDAYPSLPTKQDDFFPYASDPTAYWTGYFTSRPTTKYFERRGNAYLQMNKQLQVLANLPEHNMFVLDELKAAMGVMQHHDAITGTEKQHVANDYVRILNSAIDDANIIAKQAFNKITQRDALKPPVLKYHRCPFNESSCQISETKKSFVVTVYNPLAWKVTAPIRVPVVEGSYAVVAPNGQEITSQLIDIPQSVIDIPTRISSATHEIVFLAYLHPLGVKSYYIKRRNQKKRNANSDRKNDFYANLNGYWNDIKWKAYLDLKTLEDGENSKENTEKLNTDDVKPVKDSENIDLAVKRDQRIPYLVNKTPTEAPVAKDLDFDVLKDKNEVISEDILQLQKIIKEAKDEGKHKESAKRLNYPTLSDEEMRMLSDEPVIVQAYGDTYIENEFTKLRIDNSTGRIVQVNHKNTSIAISVDIFSYIGHAGDNTNITLRASGAYIFRPLKNDPQKLDPRGFLTREGPVVSEARVRLMGNAASTLRLYNGLDYIEHEFIAGPLPVDDEMGKEYITVYNSEIRSGTVFYTDSNGRQILRRQRDERPQWNLTLAEPVPGNYYPVTEIISIEDESNRMSIITDRSEGGSSMKEGQIELMIHRRLLHDDAFGVGEALDETVDGMGLVVRGNHRILLDTTKNDERKNILEFHYKPVVFISDAEHLDMENWLTMNNMFKGVNIIPPGIHLLTLEPWKDGALLLRLENYLESGDNSTVEVDLETLLDGLKIRSYKETTLAANQWIAERENFQWKKEKEFAIRSDSNKPDQGTDQGLKVRLVAKQIRTFVVEYEHVKVHK